MNVVKEVDMSVEEAMLMMTDFANDEYLQEIGTTAVKSVNRIAANLAVAAHEISMPDYHPDEAVEPQSPRRRKHRRHHHQAEE